MQSNGRNLHAQAASAREKGEYAKSLDLNDKALFEYEAENDSLGFAEGVACRSITLRVYANLNDNRRLLTLAKHEMIAAVVIARESGNQKALPIPLFNLAKLQEDLGELQDAVASYKEAVENMQKNPPIRHNRPAILSDMKVHLTVCQYKAGDKTAIEKAKNALLELEKAKEASKYNKDVWVSGGYMKIAEALSADDPNKAKEYFQKAKEIIDANPELVLRNQQWKKLNAALSL